jgi:tetratricopeptide (TPR) repeat protein
MRAPADKARSSPDSFPHALALHERGMLPAAEQAYAAILARQPEHFDALHMLGVIALQTNRAAQGVALISQALAVNPRAAGAHCNLGIGLHALKRFEAAVASYDIAIALAPDNAGAYNNRGNALHQLQRYDAALASYEAAIALNPNYVEAYNNRGATLYDLRRLDEALASYATAIALKPDYAEAHSNRGVTLRDLQRHADALASYETAIALRPDLAEAQWSKGVCLLQMGDFARGWAQYEWRRRLDPPLTFRSFAQPLWTGQQDIAGKTLFIHHEQGHGDTIQFCRYATLARARGARVVVSVPNQLRELLTTLGPGIDIIGGDEDPRDFDYHCPMMSLPLAFGTTLETIPAHVPYLGADPARIVRWQGRLAGLAAFRVGLCWAGAPRRHLQRAHAIDRRRSIALAQYAPLGAIPGVGFVSLQKGDAAAEAVTPPSGLTLHDWTHELRDFADTAALIAALDLVITVDTSVAHLAGALGKSVWVLNRFDACWRWLTDRTDSPWHPTARLWRQPEAGDWESVVAQVAVALRSLIGEVCGPGRSPRQ